MIHFHQLTYQKFSFQTKIIKNIDRKIIKIVIFTSKENLWIWRFWAILTLFLFIVQVPFVCTTAWTSLSADFWNFSQPHFCPEIWISRWLSKKKVSGFVKVNFCRCKDTILTTDQSILTEHGLLAPSNYAIVRILIIAAEIRRKLGKSSKMLEFKVNSSNLDASKQNSRWLFWFDRKNKFVYYFLQNQNKHW